MSLNAAIETVLVVGSTGNIGTSAVVAALRSKRNILAVVRNQDSADRLVKNIGSSEGITFVEADVLSDKGVKSVVEKVRQGKLPAFQHVWASVGGEYTTTPLQEITLEQLRRGFNTTFEADFFAYQATIPYLLEQNHPTSTWTMCTGSQGDLGFFAIPAMTQGALFSMAVAAARENENTNVRFNEVYLAFRVENDEDAVAHGVLKASEFAKVYEQVLEETWLKGARIRVDGVEDLEVLKWEKKF